MVRTVTGVSDNDATTIKGGNTNSVLYQQSVGVTGFIANADGVLASNGVSAPSFVDPETLLVGNSETALDLLGGQPGDIHYQMATDNTTFLSIAAAGHILTSNGVAPIYSDPATVTVGKATNLVGGAADAVVVQEAVDDTKFINKGAANTLFGVSSGNALGFQDPANITVGRSTNVAGGSAGGIPIQSGANTTTFVTPGSAGNLLVSTGSSAAWVAPTSSLGTIIPTPLIALGCVMYQSYLGVTGSLADPLLVEPLPGVSYVLRWNGPLQGFSWANLLTLTSGVAVEAGNALTADEALFALSATKATNIAGGTTNDLPYQTAANTTGFLGGAANTILARDSSGVPVFTNQAVITRAAGGFLTRYKATNANAGTGIAFDNGVETVELLLAFESSQPTFIARVIDDGLTSREFKIKNDGRIILPTSSDNRYVNAPFLKTSSTRVIEAGTILPETAGGTGQSALSAVSVGSATNLTGATPNTVPFQSAAGVTSFVSGVAGNILTINGSGVPTFQPPTAVTTVANLSGGAAGNIVYQTAANTTGFLGGGADTVLTRDGSGTPAFTNNINLSTNFSTTPLTIKRDIGNSNYGLKFEDNVNASQSYIYCARWDPEPFNSKLVFEISDIETPPGEFRSLQIVPDGTIQLPTRRTSSYANAAFLTTDGARIIQAGTILPTTAGGTGASSLSTVVTGASTNIAGGATNQIPYQTGASTTGFLGGSAYSVLTRNASGVPSFTNELILDASTATTPLSIRRGVSGFPNYGINFKDPVAGDIYIYGAENADIDYESDLVFQTQDLTNTAIRKMKLLYDGYIELPQVLTTDEYYGAKYLYTDNNRKIRGSPSFTLSTITEPLTIETPLEYDDTYVTFNHGLSSQQAFVGMREDPLISTRFRAVLQINDYDTGIARRLEVDKFGSVVCPASTASPYESAPFLTTDSDRKIIKGTILGESAGGTGQSSLASVTVGKATSLTGATVGSVPYQSSSGVTSYLTGATNQFLGHDGSGPAFQYLNINHMSYNLLPTTVPFPNNADSIVGLWAPFLGTGYSLDYDGVGSFTNNSGRTLLVSMSFTGRRSVLTVGRTLFWILANTKRYVQQDVTGMDMVCLSTTLLLYNNESVTVYGYQDSGSNAFFANGFLTITIHNN